MKSCPYCFWSVPLLVLFLAPIALILVLILRPADHISFRFEAGEELGSKTPLTIALLGDTFAAGNGAGSIIDTPHCHRSTQNWGQYIAETLKEHFAVQFINRACTNANLDNLSNPQKVSGQTSKADGSCPQPVVLDNEVHTNDKESQTSSCTTYIRPQLEAIGTNVDLVFMTAGANDLEFPSGITACFAPGLHNAPQCKNAVENAEYMMPDFKDKLIDTFIKIRSKLRPEARVIFVSYPYLSTDDDYSLDSAYDVAEEVRGLGLLLDSYVAEAIAVANAAAREKFIYFYSDAKALFSGHEPNPDPYKMNENRWIWETEAAVEPLAWYHPNPIGNAKLGQALTTFEPLQNAIFGKKSLILKTVSENKARVDIALVIESRQSIVKQVQALLPRLIRQLASKTFNYRLAVISYQQSAVPSLACTKQHAFDDGEVFTKKLSNLQSILNAFNYTDACGNTMDNYTYSDMEDILRLPWLPAVARTVFLIGNSSLPDSDDTGNNPTRGPGVYLKASKMAKDFNEIGIRVNVINNGGAGNGRDMVHIAENTCGSAIDTNSDDDSIGKAVKSMTDMALNAPIIWMEEAYSGLIGTRVLFDASGSFDPNGYKIDRYEWDFDGDSIFESISSNPMMNHTYHQEYRGPVFLRITSNGGTTISSTYVFIKSSPTTYIANVERLFGGFKNP